MKKITFLLLILASFVSFAQTATESTKSTDMKYRRSSIYTLMTVDPTADFADTIQKAFIKSNQLDKFDDHNLVNRVVPYQTASKAQAVDVNKINIDNHLKTNNIAKEMVAKWFNRNEKGEFDMSLISKRGYYNASDIDVNNAKLNQRGTALLADAGEELIKNTFILVSHFRYYDKAEDAAKAKVAIGIFASVAGALGVPGARQAAQVANMGATVLGKGYRVKSISYLYRLRWNDSIASVFYNQYWTDASNFDENKKKEFDNSNIFTLDYIGSDNSYEDVQSTIFTNKRDDELVVRATNRAVDGVIAKLQRNHDEFRTKTPLISTDPITAKIGLKEGLEPGDKFDVLEQVTDENGKTAYKKIGQIKVDKKQIWDNRYTIVGEEPKNKTVGRTLFKKISGGDFYPGMLIKQAK